MKEKTLLLAILLVFLLIAFLLNMATARPTSLSSETESVQLGKKVYVAQELGQSCDYDCDVRLLAINSSGESEIISDNLTDIFRKQTGSEAFILAYYFPPEGDVLIFQESDSKGSMLYKFDVSETAFTELTNGVIRTFMDDLPSSDQLYILRMSEDGKAFTVTNVPADTIIATVRAGSDESFIEQLGCHGWDPIGKYAWSRYGDGFEYDVFRDEPIPECNVPRSAIRTDYYVIAASEP